MDSKQTKEEQGILKLYVSGHKLKSVRAQANLRQLSELYLKGNYQIEVCDLANYPDKAKQDNITMTPTLVRQYPPPSTKIIGDLSDTAQVLFALNEADHVYRAIVEQMTEGYVSLARDGTILSCNKAFSDMIGKRRDLIIGSSILNMVDIQEKVEIKNYLAKKQSTLRKKMNLFSKSKDIIAVLSSASRVDLGGNELVCMLFTNISTQKEAEGTSKKREVAITRLAYFDKLTGLPNRMLFKDRLGNAVRNAKRSGCKLAVMFIDLDNFKKVNDTMGHEAGDALLKEIGGRIQRCIRESDTLSRMGGDEFALLMRIDSDIKEADTVGRRIIQAASQPCKINHTTHVLSASIGIAVFPENGRSGDELLKNADTAMYKSKAQGKNQSCFFDEWMREEILKKVWMEGYLREALDQKELKVFFQPQFEISTGEIRGMEALMRWHSSRLGNVPPDQFIPIAEENRLILRYGDWVLRQACRTNKEWQNKGLPKIPVAVNISSREFEQESFVSRIVEALDDTGLDPCYLELEITESIMIHGNMKAIAKLEALREMGVCISLDDFGTGYSSLNYLNTLPLGLLKIDKSFIANLQRQKNDVNMVRAIISLAHSLGLKVVAEGVENSEQVNILKKSRCDFLQGFICCPPVNEEMAETLLYKARDGNGNQKVSFS
ncbi:MAG: EAL domain-containing protein [Negativicutes bacterium]|nr:EAL domain-containing protein [Negativicutes bacterium]